MIESASPKSQNLELLPVAVPARYSSSCNVQSYHGAAVAGDGHATTPVDAHIQSLKVGWGGQGMMGTALSHQAQNSLSAQEHTKTQKSQSDRCSLPSVCQARQAADTLKGDRTSNQPEAIAGPGYSQR